MVLDTHIFVRWVLGETLSDARVAAIEQAAPEMRLVSAISLLEIAQLVSKGRLQLEMPVREWLEKPFAEGYSTLVPISAEVAAEAYNLPGDFHKDPADRIIVATRGCARCRS